MKALQQCKPVLAVMMAMGVAVPSSRLLAEDANSARPVMATEQPALPATGPNPGDNRRSQMQASPGAATTLATGEGIHDSFGTPLIAREVPAALGTGPNSGDLARADMQSDPSSYAALGTRYPAQPGAGSVAGNPQLHGRGGWNPALVQLQATPRPMPWETRLAKGAAPDRAVSAEAKP